MALTTEHLPPATSPEDQPDKKKLSRGKKIGLVVVSGIVGVSIAAGIAVGLSPKGTTDKPNTLPDEPTPTPTSEVVTPTEETTPDDVVTLPESTPEPGSVTPEAEYDIAPGDYEQLVENYSIRLPQTASAEEVYTAVLNKLNTYYAANHNAEDRENHYEWVSEEDPQSQPGWNAWSTNLNQDAFMDALFVEGYAEPGVIAGSNAQLFSDNKTNVNRLWANTERDGTTPYELSVSYAIDTLESSVQPGAFDAIGTLTYQDNASSSETNINDSSRYDTTTAPGVNIRVEYAPTDDRWIITRYG